MTKKIRRAITSSQCLDEHRAEVYRPQLPWCEAQRC